MINNSIHFDNMWPFVGVLGGGFLLLIFIELILKAIALWKAARADQMVWFIALMIINTMGVLPLIYLLFFAKEPKTFTSSKKPAKQTKKRA